MLLLSIFVITQLGAMEGWDVEKMATRMANQRRADDKALIKEYRIISNKNYKDLTHDDKMRLKELAGKYKSFCLLESVCESALFEDKEMEFTIDNMLSQALASFSTLQGLSKRRARLLKNIELLLKKGAAQNETRFKAFSLGHYVFASIGVTTSDFKVRHITEDDRLQLVGLFAAHVKHDGFKKALETELSSNPNRDWALKIAHIAIENDMEQSLMDVALRKATV